MHTHLKELDSIRGLAALTVVFGHFLLVYPMLEPNTYQQTNYELLNIFKYSPLHIFWAGHEAVIIFFILSGLVLSLPFYKKDFNWSLIWYSNFVIKRFFRIYLPYFVTIILAIGVVLAVVGGSQINHLSDFINRIGSSSLTFSELLSHIFFIGDYDTTRINPVIWSLVHEMRISLIFPFLMLLVIRLDFKKNLLVALGSSLIVFLCVRTFGHSLTGILNTVHYASFFIVGALIARYRVSTVAKIRDLSSLCKYLLLVIAILAYTYSWNLYGIEIIHLYVIDDWAIAFGSVIFILLSLSSKRISALLNWRPILFTGKISYSLYLCHIIVLLSMVHTFNAYLSTWLILVMALILSYILAAFLYYKVELPSINLGRKLTQPFYYKQQAKM